MRKDQMEMDNTTPGSGYDFFGMDEIPPGAYLISPIQLGREKLYVTGREKDVRCVCNKHEHTVLHLEKDVMCGWCETKGEYVWGKKKPEYAMSGKGGGSMYNDFEDADVVIYSP